ncbi:MAG: DNA polymerase, partial [Thermodesulfobacteriota bacterium]
AQIRTDAAFDFDPEACRRRAPDQELLMSLFREFEFSSLLQDLKIRGEESAGDYRICRTSEELAALASRLRQGREFSLEPLLSSPEAMSASLVGLAVSPALGEGFYIPIAHEDGMPRLPAGTVLTLLSPFLADPAIPKHGQDLKTALIVLSQCSIPLRGLGCDTMVASYLLNPAKHSFELADTVLDHLGRRTPSVKELVGSGAKAVPFASISVEKAADYAGRRADAVMSLAADLSGKIAAAGMRELLDGVETPLVAVLAAMEQKGVLLDLPLLRSMSLEIEQLLALSEEKIHRLAGEKFNISSPKQLQVVLFEKLGLPRGRKTKEGYSTDVDVLTALAQGHELPAEILAYRGMAKLKSTYIDALPELVHPRT